MNAMRPSAATAGCAARQPMSVEGTSGAARPSSPHPLRQAVAQMLLLDAPAVHATRRPSRDTAMLARDGPVTGSAVGRGSPAVTPSSPIGSHHKALVSRAANSTPRASGATANSDVRRGCALISRTSLVLGSAVHNAAPMKTPAGAATANSTRPVLGIHCGTPCDPTGRPGAVSGVGGVRPSASTSQIVESAPNDPPALRSAGARDWKAMRRPSGDHVGCAPHSVILRAVPPRDGTIQMPLPASSVYAIRRPSGDHAGWMAWWPVPRVSDVGTEPSARPST